MSRYIYSIQYIKNCDLKRYFFLLFFSFFSIAIFGQGRIGNFPDFETTYDENNSQDTIFPTGRSKAILEKKIKDYRYWHQVGDTMILDTALTIKTLHSQNFLMKDYFGNMPFSNIGQTFNPLTYARDENLVPDIGFSAKQFNYWKPEDIRYFDVKSPLTEFRYIKGMRDGQGVSSLFSYSPTKPFNITLRYYGLRSLGRYREQLSNTQKFLASANYRSRNGRYSAIAHFNTQKISNEENGGIDNPEQFENENRNNRFLNRRNVTLNLQGVSTIMDNRRVFLQHMYNLFYKRGDSLNLNNGLSFYHQFLYEGKRYTYEEQNENNFYDELSDNFGNDRFSKTRYDFLSNEFWINGRFLQGKVNFSGGLAFSKLSYGYDSIINTIDVYALDKIQDEVVTLKIKSSIEVNRKIAISGKIENNISANEFKDAYKIKAQFNFKPLQSLNIEAGLRKSSTYPTLNYWLHQSFYKRFTFNTNPSLINENGLWGLISYKKYGSLRADWSTISNLAYINENYESVQSKSNIQILKLSMNNNWLLWTKTIGKVPWEFKLENAIVYNNIIDRENAIPLPKLVTRNTLYMQGKMFKGNLHVQTGFIFHYFSRFLSRDFFPVLNEYRTQTNLKIGNFPRFDYFIHGKVDRFRFMLKVEHFNSNFTGFNYYSAPHYPYTDWIIRVGIIWYFNT